MMIQQGELFDKEEYGKEFNKDYTNIIFLTD